MLFKRLEIVGFKSFGDKTVFEFEPGITTIVGPNGCGKSNVSDAIRWVLGEQSAKALRGSRMEDVIFNGTDERPPINIAEVSFTLEDPEKVLPLGFHEITVTRRVFRDGQSEYFINKAACRLRDIHELFMGTGIGTDAYSILEQGKMDMVLNAKAQERREIFEEAAGITKFKAKKVEALRKLEHTEENLVRVNDIVKEVKRQIQSVQRYAAKASRYRKLFDEMKDLEVAFHAHRFAEIQSVLGKAQSDLSEIYKTQKEKLSESEQAEARLGDLREALQGLTEAHEVLREEAARLESDIQRREGQARMDEQRVQELGESAARWESEIQEHRAKIQKLEQEISRSQVLVQQLDGLVKTTREEVSARDENLRRLQEQIRTLTQRQKELQERLMEGELDATRWKNEMAGLAASAKTTVVKRERLISEQQGLEGRGHQLQDVLAAAREEIAQQGQKVEKLRQEIAGTTDLCAQVQKKIDAAQEQSERLREELAKKKALVSVMGQDNSGGWKSGAAARWFLGKQKQDPAAWTGLIGKVGDLLKVENGYEAATRAGLGSCLEDLAVEGRLWIEKVREHLKDHGGQAGGGVAVVSGDMMRCRSEEQTQGLEDPRILGPMKKFLKLDPRIASAVLPLIGHVYVVGSWRDAAALGSEFRDHGARPTFVTLGGDCIEASGRIVLAGREDGARRLGSEDAPEGMTHQVERLQEVFHDTIVEKGGYIVALEEWKGKMVQLQTALKQEEIRQATLAHELGKLESQENQTFGNRTMIQKELDEAHREEEHFLQEQGRYAQILREYEITQNARKQELEKILGQLEERTAAREALAEDVTRRKIQLASLEEKLENGTVQVRNLAERLAESRGLYESKVSDAEGAKEKMTALREALDGWKSQVDALAQQRDLKQEELKQASADRNASTMQCEQLEKRLVAARTALSGLTDRQRTLEVERAGLAAQKENLRENLLKEFQVDLAAPVSSDQESVFSLEAFGGTWDAVRDRVAELRKTLEGIGPVNMSALQEHDELQARFDFLTKQHEDLVQAKQTLLKVLSRINTTTRKLFADTFAQIRTNFQNIYVQLFGGGKADLLLTDESDILETGIEIVAKPPGKQLRNVSLLSGGEKALTAIALLFAIFQVKPSPFCVLDEIDAPLDESNIARFVDMLRDYAKKTQFIVITHNKRTIAQADVLYGITMQESGISKVVSVRLADDKKVPDAGVPQGPRFRQGVDARPLFDRPSLTSFSRGSISATEIKTPAEEAQERREE